ncbi:MAG: peptidylprolyl isomerase [Candidatus Zixiibacteriota bacterium]
MLRQLLFTLVLICALSLHVGCANEPVAKDGDTVKVHYTGTHEDGSEFDSSRGGEPLEFVLGKPGIIGGFQDAVRGMKAGEVKTVTFPPENAYGMPRPEMIHTYPLSELPDNIEPKVGESLTLTAQNGQMLQVTITELTDSTITLDANHPLAGKTLTFELELVEIIPPTDSAAEGQ